MNLTKAIETLENSIGFPHSDPWNDKYRATVLGIEALKRIKHIRTLHKFNPLDIMPGETEED